MATYTNLTYGSQGDDVKSLQNTLNQNGYSLSEDGIFGSKTQAALKDYQTKNGLTSSGTVDEATNSKLTGSGSTASEASGNASTGSGSSGSSAKDYTSFTYNPSGDSNYLAALEKLQDIQSNQPQDYTSKYSSDVDAAYNAIMNRKAFSYEAASDPAYQQYKEQYTTLGQNAMADTIGQAAALTGGYGSSYATTAGQQTYDSYMQQLANKIPDLEQNAYDRYQNETATLQDNLSAAESMENQDYNRYQDRLTNWQNERDTAQSAVDTAYSNGFNAYAEAQSLAQQDYENRYNAQQDAYDNLVTVISNTGYSPSTDELTAAGMSASEAAYWKQYYQTQQASVSSGSGSSSGSSGGSSSYGGSGSSSTLTSTDTGKSTSDLQQEKYEYLLSYGSSLIAKGTSTATKTMYKSSVNNLINNYVNNGYITSSQASTLKSKLGI